MGPAGWDVQRLPCVQKALLELETLRLGVQAIVWRVEIDLQHAQSSILCHIAAHPCKPTGCEEHGSKLCCNGHK